MSLGYVFLIVYLISTIPHLTIFRDRVQALICKNDKKRSPFDHLISCHDDLEPVKLLVSKLENKLQDDELREELFSSIKQNYKDELSIPQNVDDFIKILLTKYIIYATSWGRNELTKFLLEKGVNPNTTDAGSNTPLHFAVQKGNLCIVKLLLEKGAIVNAKDSDSRTPLHWAVCKNDLGSVQALLGKGADATLVTNKGSTSLHVAIAVKGSNELIEALLNRVKNTTPDKLNSFINAKKNDGTTAINLARGNEYIEKMLDQALREAPSSSVEGPSVAVPSSSFNYYRA